MKKIFILLFASQIHFSSHAQWTKLTSGFEENAEFRDLFFINNDVGFVVGGDDDGILLKTIDGGQTWNAIPINLGYPSGIWFTNDQTGFIAGSNKILKTTNQGNSWTEVNGCSACNFQQLFFLNENTGYVYYDGLDTKILKTTDGGNTWTIKSTFGEGYMNDIYFLSETSGVVAFYDHSAGDTYVKGTHNGGNAWSNLLSDGTLAQGYGSLWALNTQTIVTTGSHAVAITSDGGTTWTEYPYPFTDDNGPRVHDIVFTSATEGWIAGKYILYTQDGGYTWITAAINLGVELDAIKFPSADTGYATGGYKGAIFKYVNSGNPIPTAIDVLGFDDTFCPGETIAINYVTAGAFNSGNVFIAQLSDANGSFATSTNIGSVATTSSGHIDVTFPPLIPEGNGYRIRVIGSDPSTIGYDNGEDFEIKCPAPQNPQTKKITTTSAKLQWYFVDCGNGYRVRYRKDGTPPWIKINVSDADKVLMGLEPNTAYEWGVQTKCMKTPKVYSDWSPTETFTTSPFKIMMNEEAKKLTLYPNPNSGHFEVQVGGEFISPAAKIFIKDMLGRTVYVSERTIGENPFSIKLGEKIPDGIYFITIQTSLQSSSGLFEVQK